MAVVLLLGKQSGIGLLRIGSGAEHERLQLLVREWGSKPKGLRSPPGSTAAGGSHADCRHRADVLPTGPASKPQSKPGSQRLDFAKLPPIPTPKPSLRHNGLSVNTKTVLGKASAKLLPIYILLQPS